MSKVIDKDKGKIEIVMVAVNLKEPRSQCFPYTTKRKALLGTELKASVFLVFTQSQETHKTIGVAAILVSQTKETTKILLLRVHLHSRRDVM